VGPPLGVFAILLAVLKAFGGSIFLSAALLFLVQPMAGKILLPLLGGSPAVWNTCMVFFQAVLLLGYLYAHLLTTRLAVKWQAIVHLGVMVVAGVTLPSPIDVGEPTGDPRAWVLKTLLLTVGLPFFVVSTSGPLLQKWFSRTNHPAAKDPYFLYAASNAGSVVGLLLYPFVAEPLFTRWQQTVGWTGGYWVLVPAVAACAWLALKHASAQAAAPAASTGSEPGALAATPVTWRRRAMWTLLALTPSSLMVGVTQHISTDIAAIPLLWIGPLLLYLVTFILAFSGRWGWSARGWGRLLGPAAVVLLLVLLAAAKSPAPVIVSIHLAVFFIAAMTCHRRLAEDRPDPAHLTEFYLLMSLGGVLGGAFNALAAPILFREVLEYPIMLGVACLLRPQVRDVLDASRTRAGLLRRGAEVLIAPALLLGLLVIDGLNEVVPVPGGPSMLVSSAAGKLLKAFEFSDDTTVNILRAGVPTVACAVLLLGRGAWRFAISATALFIGSQWIGSGGGILYKERTFFGVIEVVRNPAGTWHAMYHGTTLHGLQAQTQSLRADPNAALSLEERDRLFWGVGAAAYTPEQALPWTHLVPSTYYHPTGPIGQVFRVMGQEKKLDRVALVGLGTGSLAGYSRPGMQFDIYEIDPAVITVARTPSLFGYIDTAQRSYCGTFRGFEGDGRLGLKASEDGTYDLIVLDAFSSDAVPVHLLTKDAVALYLTKLRPRGVLAFHISSRYFDLAPVVARVAGELHLTAWAFNDSTITKDQERQGKKDSLWVVVARSDADLGGLVSYPTPWKTLQADARFPLWTDDYSNLMRVFVGWGWGGEVH